MSETPLRSHITIRFLLMFALVQGAVYLVVLLTSQNTVEGRINAELDSSVQAFQQIVKAQQQNLIEQARITSRDFPFTQAVASGDDATTGSALTNLMERSGVSMAMLLDVDGTIIHQIGDGEAMLHDMVMEVERAEMSAEDHIMYVNDGERLFESVMVPIEAPVTVGWIILGVELDDQQASQVRGMSSGRVGVSFIFKRNGWKIAGASSRDGFLNWFQAHPQADNLLGITGGAGTTDYFGDTYALRFVGLPGTRYGGEYLLVYSSRDRAMADFSGMFLMLSLFNFLGLMIIIVGCYFLSKSVSGPIGRLADISANIAKGTYARIDEPQSFSEVEVLRQNFNAMSEAVRERQDRIIQQASHDTATGLGNRIMLENEIVNANYANHSYALVIVEVQKFQSLRTVLDYEQINTLAYQIAERLQTATGRLVCRVSTDSFGFFVVEKEDLTGDLRKVAEGFKMPFEPADVKIDVAIVMGYITGLSSPEAANELFLKAYSAVDQARGSDDGFAAYDPDQVSVQAQHLSMMSDLRAAMKSGFVSFHYQPKLDIASNKITGAEALIRWMSPTDGFISPEIFIPLAEETGEIHHLTAWALEQIIGQTKRFISDGIDIVVSANLSGRDLQNNELPAYVDLLLRRFDLDPRHLCLEVTESAVMHDMDRALAILDKLAKMGIALSVDDYGTGFSSLAYLKKLPVQELKIDKAFVLNLATDKEDEILVQSTIDLGHNLGMKITAEGVEDEKSLDILRQHGCEVAQGYFISRPVPAPEFMAFLTSYGQ